MSSVLHSCRALFYTRGPFQVVLPTDDPTEVDEMARQLYLEFRLRFTRMGHLNPLKKHPEYKVLVITPRDMLGQRHLRCDIKEAILRLTPASVKGARQNMAR